MYHVNICFHSADTGIEMLMSECFIEWKWCHSKNEMRFLFHKNKYFVKNVFKKVQIYAFHRHSL